jgi:REP element-mobilizing transposase RayT
MAKRFPKTRSTQQRSPQRAMLANERSSYGGILLKTRAGRRRGRPLSTKETMHLVLRSSKAKGDWSFRRSRNAAQINRIIDKFSFRYGVRVISMANVGNHLHLQIKLSNRFSYRPFIRAVTGAIAMAITGRNRWSLEGNSRQPRASTLGRSLAPSRTAAQQLIGQERFWDYRPFTRLVESFKALLNLRDYMRINQLEGAWYPRI